MIDEQIHRGIVKMVNKEKAGLIVKAESKDSFGLRVRKGLPERKRKV